MTKAPAIGIRDRKIMTAPQTSAEGRPRAAKARPPRVPWIAAMTSTPLTLAPTTSVTRLRITRVSRLRRGIAEAIASRIILPSRNR